jgi:DNA-binding CsgD family transcriptional regulator
VGRGTNHDPRASPGSPGSSDDATAVPTGLSSVPHIPKASTSLDGLTAWEVEVLRLVAQGLTDAQVAEQLVISPRTVNTHLKSIYGKIPVTSPSAATRYAIQGLFPQPLHVAHGWDAEEVFVLPIEVGGIVVAYAIGSTRRVEVLAQHQTAGLLEP